MSLGPAEVAVILILALLVFGPSRLPEVSRQMGAAMRELRKMQANVKAELGTVLDPDVAGMATGAPTFDEPDHPTTYPAAIEATTPSPATGAPSTADFTVDDAPSHAAAATDPTDDGFPAPSTFS